MLVRPLDCSGFAVNVIFYENRDRSLSLASYYGGSTIVTSLAVGLSLSTVAKAGYYLDSFYCTYHTIKRLKIRSFPHYSPPSFTY